MTLSVWATEKARTLRFCLASSLMRKSGTEESEQKWVRGVQGRPRTRIEARRVLENLRQVRLPDILRGGEGHEGRHRETVRL